MERGSRFEERARRSRQKPIGRLHEPPYPASPFYFALFRAHNLDPAKHEVVNRLLRVAPHHGLALLVMLTERGFISETRKDELRREQTHRHLASDSSPRVYEIAPEAGSNEKQRRFYAAITAFLNADDDALWARARAAEWPEFE